MLQGCTFWPEERAARYRREGWWESRTLWQTMDDSVRRWGGKTALVAGAARQTYADLDEVTARLAAALLDLGIRPLDRVVLQLPNIAEFVHYYLALVRIGAIPVMALRAHREAEVRHFIRASGAVAYIIPDRIKDFDYRAMAATMQREFPTLRHVVVVGEASAGQLAHQTLLEKAPSAEAARARLAQVSVDAEEPATILLTGGTTSLPKLIPRTHQDYALNAKLCGAAAGFDERTVFMAILPLGHNYNLASPGIFGTFRYGGTVVLAPSGSVDDVFSLVQREGVTVIAAVLPLIARWVNAPELDRYDVSSLRVVQNGGARLPPELRRRLAQRLGCTPQEIYGTAEGLINMTRLDDTGERLYESSGSPVCDADEIKVVDDDGREVPDGEPGELLTRGPYTICGYYDAPEVNAKAFTPDGFYRMGDIVRKRGRYVYAEGRRKDIINRGGENISCEEVESLLVQHPAVQSASLVAMPDPVFGEKACAFVILKPGAALDFAGMARFLEGFRIAKFKIPERLEVVPEFPLSPVGKILKRQLRETIAGKLAQESGQGKVAIR